MFQHEKRNHRKIRDTNNRLTRIRRRTRLEHSNPRNLQTNLWRQFLNPSNANLRNHRHNNRGPRNTLDRQNLPSQKVTLIKKFAQIRIHP